MSNQNELVDLFSTVPIIQNHEEMAMYLKPVYVLEDYMTSYAVYEILLKKLMNLLKGSFVIKACREYPIKFKFYKEEKKAHVMQFRHFCINLIIWKPFIEIADLKVLNSDFILNPEKDIPDMDNYINYKLIQTLRDAHVQTTTINYSVSDVLYNLRKIPLEFSDIMGLNFSLKTFIDLYQNNPRVKQLMESHYDENLQPHEIEKILHRQEKELVQLLMGMPDNPLGIILRTNSTIKHKQLTEFSISKGFMPTLEGMVIPKVIQNSTLIGGADRPSYHYLSALGSRKSLIMNKKVMGRAGYFSKLVLMLARTVSMSKEVADCGSKHLVEYNIKNKEILKKLDGKYYKLDESDDDYKRLQYNKDKDLIGKKIYARSAVTCCLGDEVCPRCLGYNSVTVFDLADGIAAYYSEEITKVLEQNILSTKHLLTTNSEVLKFNKNFDKYFSITGGEINAVINENKVVKNIEDYGLFIDPDTLERVEEMDEDTLYNTYIKGGKFYVANLKNKEEPMDVIELEGDKELYVSQEVLDILKKNKGYVPFSEINDDLKLLEVVIANQELTAPLYKLIGLLNKNPEENISHTINSVMEEFLDLLVATGIRTNVIAAEIIVNRLIRSVADPYRRPNFTRAKLEPYEIYTVSKALIKNKSPMIGLAFENLKKQILSDDLYDERNGTSYIDALFKEDIPSDNLRKYAKIVHSKDFRW